jgi:glycosyltransferase involved in cell wall biosynthesis
MRIGNNPVKEASVEWKISERLTVATVTYIPFIAGYWKQGLDVLKLCLASLWANTNMPFELMVFDNGSCQEVIDYLLELRRTGGIHFLVLSSENIGKIGAQNFLFAASRGDYTAYTDSDVYFYNGWFEEERRVLEGFSNVGMVSGVPVLHNFPYASGHKDARPEWLGKYSRSTMRQAQADPETRVEHGHSISEEWITKYSRSIGVNPQEYSTNCENRDQILLIRRGVRAFATATHFQFLAKSIVLKSILPLPVLPGLRDYVMDAALDTHGYMRISVDGYVVHHLGNVLTEEWRAEAHKLGLREKAGDESDVQVRRHRHFLSHVPLISDLLYRGSKLWRRLLVYIYKQSFKLLYKHSA